MVKRRQASPGHQMLPNDDLLRTYLLHDAIVCHQLLLQVPRHQLRVGLPRRGGEAPAEPQPKDHGGRGEPAGAPCPEGGRKVPLPSAAACAAGRAARRLTAGEMTHPLLFSSFPAWDLPLFHSGRLRGIPAGFPSCSCSPRRVTLSPRGVSHCIGQA